MYKVLQVPSYISGIMAWEFLKGHNYWLDELRQMRFSINNNVVFGRDGWYYNRVTNFSWIEYQGCFLTRIGLEQDFKYELEFENYKILPKPCIDAMKTLSVYGVRIAQLGKLWGEHNQASQCRELYRQAAYHPDRLIQKIKKLGKEKQACLAS